MKDIRVVLNMKLEGQQPRGRPRSWWNRLGKKLHRRKIKHGKHVGDGALERNRQTKRLDCYMTHTKSRCLRKRKEKNIQCYVRQALNFKLQPHTQQFLGRCIHRICTRHFVTKENIVQANINKMQLIYRIFIKSLHILLL